MPAKRGVRSARENSMELRPRERRALARAARFLLPRLPEVTERFYDYLESVPTLARVFERAGVKTSTLRPLLADWAKDLLRGRRGPSYDAGRLRIGHRHAQVGLPQRHFLVAIGVIRDSLLEILEREWRGRLAARTESAAALRRALDLDVSAICDAYVEESERELRRERERERAALLRVHDALLRCGDRLPDMGAIRDAVASVVAAERLELELAEPGGQGGTERSSPPRRAATRTVLPLRSGDRVLGRLVATGRGLASSGSAGRPFLDLVADALARAVANHLAVRAVRDSEEQYRSLAETADSMILGIDLEGRVTFFNRFAEELTGYSREEVLGRDYFGIFVPDPEVRRGVLENIEGVLRGSPTRGYENDILCRDGSRRTMLWNATRRLGADGAPVGIVAVGADVTEKRRLEREVRDSETLALIGRMTASVVHEVKNPLAGIKGVLQVFERSGSLDEDRLEMCRLMRERIDGLAEYVNDIAAFGRPLTLRRHEGTFGDLIEGLLPVLRSHEKARGVAISVEDRTDGERLHADFAHLDRALLNVLLNALDAVEGSGNVTIAARVADGRLEIEVRDTGPGFPPDILVRAGEPFLSTKPKGTGLGLSIAKRVVEAHGGRFAVENGRRGAVVRLDLPLGPSPKP